MEKKYLFLLFLILFSSIGFSQVKIKEKVELNSKTPPSRLIKSTSAPLRLVFTGSGGIHFQSGSIDYISEGSTDITFADYQGGYFSWSASILSGYFSLKIYFNNYLVVEASGDGSAAFGYGYILCDDTRWTIFRDFDFPPYYPSGGNCGLISEYTMIHPILDNHICDAGVLWDISAVISFNVNTEDVVFYNKETKQMFGNNVNIPYVDCDKYLVLSRLPYNAQREYAQISATLLGVTHQHQISLVPQSRFNIIEDELCPGSNAYIEFIPFCGTSGDGTLKHIKPKLKIIEGEQYISFYDFNSEENLGKEIEVDTDNLFQYYIKVDSLISLTNPLTTVIQCEILGNIQYDTLIITSVTSPTLLAAQQYDTISFGRTSEFYLTLFRDCGSLPEDFMFNVEIVKGNLYGELVDSSDYGEGYSGRRGQNLELLNVFGCCLIMMYDANGIVPTQVDSVVIKFDTSVPGTEPRYLTIMVEPPPIKVTLVPAEISPGDTADVKLEKWNNELKIYELFPAGQNFEIGVTKQCEYGELLKADGTTNTYFSEITEPIKFIAADTLNYDSVIVKIKAGIVEEGFNRSATQNIGTNKQEIKKTDSKERINADKKILSQKEKFILEKMKCIPDGVKQKMVSMFNKKQNNKIKSGSTFSPLEGGACAVIYAEKNGEGEAVIKNGGCEELENCGTFLKIPNVELRLVEPGLSHGNPNACGPNEKDIFGKIIKIQSGGFLPVSWKNRQEIIAQPCLNEEGNVKFNMILKENDQITEKLQPEAILDICENNIKEGNLILINDIAHMLTIIQSNPNEKRIFLEDLIASKGYAAKLKKYKIKPVVFAHENEHKKDYEAALIKRKSEMIDDKIKAYLIHCKDFKNDKLSVITNANTKYWQIVKEYIDIVLDEDRNHYYGFDSLEDYEIDVQGRQTVQDEIQKFINAIPK